MVDFDVNLIGKPKVVTAGQSLEVRPKVVFELLAAVLLKGPAGLSRVSAATKFFGHLGLENSRQQLRIAIQKLRGWLQEHECDHLFDLSGQVLAFKGTRKIDIEEFDPHKSSYTQLTKSLKPFAEGWNSDHWQPEIDELGERIGLCLESLETRTAKETMNGLLVKAAELHPTTLRIHALLVTTLRSDGREAEANEAIIKFEEAWVDRFGSSEIPSLTKFEPKSAEPSTKPLRSSRKAIFFAFIVFGAAVLGLLGFGAERSRTAWLPQVLTMASTTYGGMRLTEYKLNLNGATVNQIRRLSDGSVVLNQSKADRQSVVVCDLKMSCTVDSADTPTTDRFEGVTASILPGTTDEILLKWTGGQTLVTPPTDDPHFANLVMLSRDRFLVNEVSDDPYHSHVRLTLHSKGQRSLTFTSADGDPQTCVVTYRSAKAIYVQYSFGSKEQWKNRVGVIDLVDGQPKSNIIKQIGVEASVAGVASNGNLIVRPQFTVSDNEGFSTKDTQGISIWRKPEPTAKGKVDLGKFPSFTILGDTIFRITPDPEHLRSSISALDSNGSQKMLPDGMERQVREILGEPSGRTLFLKPPGSASGATILMM